MANTFVRAQKPNDLTRGISAGLADREKVPTSENRPFPINKTEVGFEPFWRLKGSVPDLHFCTQIIPMMSTGGRSQRTARSVEGQTY